MFAFARQRNIILASAVLLGVLVTFIVWSIIAGFSAGAEPSDGSLPLLPASTDGVVEIAAMVDGHAISRFRLEGTLASSRTQGSGLSVEEVLDGLIDYELLYLEGLRRGLEPGPDELDAAIAFNRDNVPHEAIEQALAYSERLGVRINEKEYWDHPSVRDGLKKALTVGKARTALEGSDPARRSESLSHEMTKLREAADIQRDQQVIARVR